MIKREITYMDLFTEEEMTKTFYFHLNKADLIRIIGRDKQGDWEKYVKDIVATGDADVIMNFLEDIIRDSVGERTPDGMFIKNRNIADAFIASDAYGELFAGIIMNEGEAENFFKGIIGNMGTASGAVKAKTTGRPRSKK